MVTLITPGTKILFYVPNLIGYVRFVLNIVSATYAFEVRRDGDQWITFVALYSLSQILDGIDGKVARALD